MGNRHESGGGNLSNANWTLRWGTWSAQGRRESMEDRITAEVGLHEAADSALFGVFDGHVGHRAAKFAAKRFVRTFLEQMDVVHDVAKALTRTVAEIDRAFLSYAESQASPAQDGTTACVFLVYEGRFFSCNLGDSQCLVVYDGTFFMSAPHRPHNQEESERIVSAGHTVKNYRIDGNLAVPRAIGDLPYKDLRRPDKSAVVAIPTIEEIVVSHSIDFVVLACDGLWDVVSAEVASHFVSRRCRDGMKPRDIAKELVEHALLKRSHDNVTVIIILFERTASLVD